MIKYLIIGDGESPHLLKWCRELVKYVEVYLVSSRNLLPQLREIIPETRLFTFNLNLTESGGNLQVARMVLPLFRIIGRVKPQIVNAHYITSHGVVAALAKRLTGGQFSLIQSAWGSDILVTPFRNQFYRQMTRFALKQADLATADSGVVAGIVHELASVETMVFPFGLERLPDAAPDQKEPNLFFSNRTLNKNSNIDHVLTLFARIRRMNQHAMLVVANDGPFREELERLSHHLDLQDAVTFTGFINQEEQSEYYKKAQFYFSLLTSDALSVSLLEAMAYGCIPLVSDLPDNREWVQDGVTGVIVTEATTPEHLMDLQSNAHQIAQLNRELIVGKAIFPKAIEAFIEKVRSISP